MIFCIPNGIEHGLKNIFAPGEDFNFVVSISFSFAVLFQHTAQFDEVLIHVLTAQFVNIERCNRSLGDALNTFSGNNFSFPVILTQQNV